MPGSNLNDVQTYGLLRRQYSNDVQYLEHFSNSIMNMIEKDPDVNYDGEAFFVPIRMQLNMSYGARNDGEALPIADKSKGVYAQYSSKQMYSALESTFKAATRGYKGGRPDGQWLDSLMRDTLISFEHNISLDMYGNGHGYRATVATATATQTSFTVSSSTMLLPGMKLDWYDSTLATKRGSIKISSAGIDRQARTVYIDTTFGTGQVPASAAATDVLIVEGARDAGMPADGRHIGGLARLTDNSISIGGLAPSDWRVWQSYNENAGSTLISIDLLQRLFDNMKTISGLTPNRWVLNPAQKRQYFNLLIGGNRYAQGNLNGGAQSLSFNPIRMGEDMDGTTSYEAPKILEDAVCPADVMYFFHNSALKMAEDYTTGGPMIGEEDGNTFRFRQGYDTLSAFMRYWANTIVYKRNAIGKIYGLATPTGII